MSDDQYCKLSILLCYIFGAHNAAATTVPKYRCQQVALLLPEGMKLP